MVAKKILPLALLVGLAVALLPSVFPTGPGSVLSSSAFLSSGRLAVGALVVFAGGLLTALTPCVYPLIPITVGVFGARKAERRSKAVLLTMAYVVGMGLVFSALGVVAAKTGQAFGSILGDRRFVVGLAIFLLVLAASMFGAFELSLPSGLAQKLNTVGGGGVAGAFLMGSVSGFLAAPCTGPVLTGLLAFVAESQNSGLGAMLLFIYALGIGVPFVLIGVFTLRLPRGGAWMEWVKSILGIALVALAATYLKDAFPSTRGGLSHLGEQVGRNPATWIAAALAVAGVLIGGIHRSFKQGALDFALKSAGVLLVVGAFLLRSTALNTASSSSPGLQWHVQFPGTAASSTTVFDAALARARQSSQPVMIDFGAEWCAACKELERDTYVDSRVVSEANGRFLNIKVDGTNEVDSVEALYKRFGVQALPTVAFVSSRGEILTQPRVTGFLGPENRSPGVEKVQ